MKKEKEKRGTIGREQAENGVVFCFIRPLPTLLSYVIFVTSSYQRSEHFINKK